MCEHIPRVQKAKNGWRDFRHEQLIFDLSCEPVEKERQLRLLNAAVLAIQDYVPGLYQGQPVPENTNESDADKYVIDKKHMHDFRNAVAKCDCGQSLDLDGI